MEKTHTHTQELKATTFALFVKKAIAAPFFPLIYGQNLIRDVLLLLSRPSNSETSQETKVCTSKTNLLDALSDSKEEFGWERTLFGPKFLDPSFSW